jgi:hypothetical protein
VGLPGRTPHGLRRCLSQVVSHSALAIHEEDRLVRVPLEGATRMQVEERPITSIRPYEQNPRLNDSAVDAVATSIQEFGFRQPIVVDEQVRDYRRAHAL